MYSVDSSITSAGESIHSSSWRAAQKPNTPTASPASTLTTTAVCTVSETSWYWRAPICWAIMMLTPTDMPKNRLIVRLISAPVEPTAASA